FFNLGSAHARIGKALTTKLLSSLSDVLGRKTAWPTLSKAVRERKGTPGFVVLFPAVSPPTSGKVCQGRRGGEQKNAPSSSPLPCHGSRWLGELDHCPRLGLPKPDIFAEPSSVVAPGTNVTLRCSALQSTSQELLFTLLKAGSPGYPHPDKTGSEARFSLPSVKVRDAGSYSCFYSERRHAKGKSETSETLDLVVTGSLPRPSLQALPSAKVSLNGRVTLRCVLPVKPSLGSVMFMWLKAGTPEPLGRALQQSQRWADFTLQSVTVQDAGSFRCVYYEKTVQPRASEPSEPLHVCVTDSLTRPSLTVEPSSSVSLGEKVTLWCQSASCGTRFTLNKDGEDKPVQTIDSPQDKAGFLIPRVTRNHTGTYYCLHHTGEDIPTPALYSDPLELSVSGERGEPVPEAGEADAYPVNNLIRICLAALVLAVIGMVLSYDCHSPRS
uniref:Ig-like domain-containing protein n=1 Tax=Monodelphis domestica TaxID=13616 RepID=F6QRD1_MONDO